MKNKFYYGIGNLGYSVISQTIISFFMFYGTSVLQLSGVLVGLAIAISTFWDGITDPIVGYISDKYKIKNWGHRVGYMFFATFGMAISNIILWVVPIQINAIIKFIWILVALILVETFNTLYQTPYSALGNDLSRSYHDRTKIQIAKTIFYIIGMIIPSILLAIFLPNTKQYPIGQLNPNGYKIIAVISSIICIVSGLICVFKHKKSKYKNDKVEVTKFNFISMIKSYFSILKNKQFLYIILGSAISFGSAVFLTSVGLTFFTYCFDVSTLGISIIMTILLLSTIISQPLWFYISKNKDKKQSLLLAIFSSIIGVFVIIIIYICRVVIVDYAYYLLIVGVVVCGFGSGALYSLPASMYNDLITKTNKLSNKDNTATYCGILSFFSKFTNAILLLIVGILLDIIKLDTTKIIQTLSVQTGLALVLFVGIQICLITSYYIFSKVDDKK